MPRGAQATSPSKLGHARAFQFGDMSEIPESSGRWEVRDSRIELWTGLATSSLTGLPCGRPALPPPHSGPSSAGTRAWASTTCSRPSNARPSPRTPLGAWPFTSRAALRRRLGDGCCDIWTPGHVAHGRWPRVALAAVYDLRVAHGLWPCGAFAARPPAWRWRAACQRCDGHFCRRASRAMLRSDLCPQSQTCRLPPSSEGFSWRRRGGNEPLVSSCGF